MTPSNVYEKLSSIGVTLSDEPAPKRAYEPFIRAGSFLYVSGHIARRDGKPWVGQLGAGFGVVDGRAAARAVAIDLMGTLHAAAGDLNKVRLVKLLVLVNSTPEFSEQHLVANGASELLVEAFGERGRHARSAFGAAQIPFGSLVEIELVAEVESGTPKSTGRRRPV